MSEQKKYDSQLLVEFLFGMLLCILLPILAGRVLLYHRVSGVLEGTLTSGQNLYFRMANGNQYRADACQDWVGKAEGYSVDFTAFGIDLPLPIGPTQLTPVIVECIGYGPGPDELKPLPN